MQFPAVEGDNLTGDTLDFPRDFGGHRTIAIIAFDLKARSDLESWVAFVDRYVRDGSVTGRIFAVMPHSMKMMQRMIVGAMRKAVPAEARASTVPLFVDIEAFCAALGITDRKALYVCVIEPDASVHALQIGAYTQTAGDAIDARLTAPA